MTMKTLIAIIAIILFSVGLYFYDKHLEKLENEKGARFRFRDDGSIEFDDSDQTK